MHSIKQKLSTKLKSIKTHEEKQMCNFLKIVKYFAGYNIKFDVGL